MNGTKNGKRTEALKILGWICLALSVFFVAETWYELHRSGMTWDQLGSTPAMGRSLASTVSRAFNNLLAMVLGFVSLAIPLTANMYTPKLVEIFFADRVNKVALVFFAGLSAHAVFGQWIMFDQWTPVTHITVLVASGVLGFAVLIPYYLYVLDFLNPATIIRRVRDRVTSEFPRIGKADLETTQRRLHERVLQLSNVILRAVDRADRDVAIDAISALEDVLRLYSLRKRSVPNGWKRPPADLFPGLAPDALALLETEETWFEHLCLSQLHLAYCAALAKMPDAISAISVVNRQIGRGAAQRGDDAVVRLTIRYFNTFVRTAITKRDVHAVFDVLHQYRQFAVDLLGSHPVSARDVVRHLRYYARQGRAQGMAFVFELSAGEAAAIVEGAYEAKCPLAGEIAREFDEMHHDGPSPRLVKADAALAAWFESAGRTTESAVCKARLRAAPREMVVSARSDIDAVTDPVFWEVTDRQMNIDYFPPPRRAQIVALLDAVLAAVPSAPVTDPK